MKQDRNISQEINSLKSRKEFEGYNQIHHKLDNIQTSIQNLSLLKGEAKIELTKYIPVALVASMESFMRSTIAKLINNNDDFLFNAKNLLKNKFDLEIYSKLHKREFSIGEFLSHQMAFSKFEDISNQFDAILKNDFMDELKNYTVKTVFSGYQGPHPKDFSKKYVQIVVDIKRILELRHIICHEMSNNLTIEIAEIETLFKSVKALIYQIYNYTYGVLFPDTLLADEQLHQKAVKKHNEAKEKLNTILIKIYSNPVTAFGISLDLKSFKKAQEHWEKYIKLYTESLYEQLGGNVRETFILDDLADMIDDRADDLILEFSHDFE